MGLDMYAFTTKTVPACDVDFDEPEDAKTFHYWRKHPNLHGWMERLYRRKGGTSNAFNCDTLRLTESDLFDLECAVRRKELPPTQGFFFGESDGTELDDDLAFITKARAAIKDGLTVYYSSLW